MLDISEQLESAPQHAARHGLAGMASDGLALHSPVDRHDEVDLGLGATLERDSVLVAQLLGNGVGEGPAEDRQIEGVRGPDRGGGGVAWSG